MAQEYNKQIEQSFKTKIWDEAKVIAKKNPEILTDVTGIFDPTPISDGISTIAALAKGDWLGAGLSAISMVPYLGDALAKPAKFIRYGKRGEKIASMMKTMFTKADDLANSAKSMAKHLSDSQVFAARKKALAKVRKKMLNARKNNPNCKKCAEFAGKLKMPSKGGKWKPKGSNDPNSPNFGTGEFSFTKKLPDGTEVPNIKVLPDGTKVDSIKYKNGFPDFDQYVKGGKHDIRGLTGDVAKDRILLKSQHNITSPGKNYTLHHFQDGQVGYVPQSIHNVAEGGVAHAGGNSMLNSKLF